MNTPTDSGNAAASLPLPTEEQVKAFILAKATAILADGKFGRVYFSAFISLWKCDAEMPGVQFALSPDGAPNVIGGTVAEALRKHDEQHGPDALRVRVQKLREEAAAIEAKLVRFEITNAA